MYLQLAEVDLAESLSLQWMVVTFEMLSMQKFFQGRDLEGRERGWRAGRGKNSGRPPRKAACRGRNPSRSMVERIDSCHSQNVWASLDPRSIMR